MSQIDSQHVIEVEESQLGEKSRIKHNQGVQYLLVYLEWVSVELDYDFQGLSKSKKLAFEAIVWLKNLMMDHPGSYSLKYLIKENDEIWGYDSILWKAPLKFNFLT